MRDYSNASCDDLMSVRSHLTAMNRTNDNPRLSRSTVKGGTFRNRERPPITQTMP